MSVSFCICKQLATMIMRWVLIALILPCFVWAQDPVHVPIKVRFTSTLNSGATPSSGKIEAYFIQPDGALGEKVEVSFDAARKPEYRVNDYLPIELGAECRLAVSTVNCAASSVTLVPPNGYRILIDGVEKKVAALNSTLRKVRILPSLDGQPAAPGVATELTAGPVKWGASLGNDRNGASLGWLWLVSTAINDASWANMLSPLSIHFENDKEDVTVYKANLVGTTTPAVRYLRTAAVHVDIVAPNSPCTAAVGTAYANVASAAPNTLEVRFYHITHTALISSIYQPDSLSRKPFVKYLLTRQDDAGSKTLLITKTSYDPETGAEGLAERTTLRRSGAGPGFTWIAKGWFRASENESLVPLTRAVWQSVIQDVVTLAPGYNGAPDYLVTKTAQEIRRIVTTCTYPNEATASVDSTGTNAVRKTVLTYERPKLGTNYNLGLPLLPQQADAGDGPALTQTQTQFNADENQPTSTKLVAQIAARYRFGLPKVTQSNGGSWSAMTYWDPNAAFPYDTDPSVAGDQFLVPEARRDRWIGLVAKTYAPWLDTPLPSLNEDGSPAASSGIVETETHYVEDELDYPSRVARVSQRISGNLIGNSVTTYSLATMGQGSQQVNVAETGTWENGSGSQLATSKRYYYTATNNKDLFRNQVSAEVAPNGQAMVTLRQWGRVFTLPGNQGGSNGVAETYQPETDVHQYFNTDYSYNNTHAPWSLLGTLSGSVNPPAVADMQLYGSSAADLVTSYNGFDFGPCDLYVIPGKTTLQLSYVDGRRNLRRTETLLRNFSQGWDLVAWSNLTYNLRNQLIETVSSNLSQRTKTVLSYRGVVDGAGRFVYSAAGLVSDYKTREVTYAPDDVTIASETLFEYDALGRVVSTVVKGFSGPVDAAYAGLIAPRDEVRSFVYDAADQILVETRSLVASGGESNKPLAQITRVYDQAGRLTSESELGGQTRTSSYQPSANRTTTVTASGTAAQLTRVAETYFDGRPKSVTGLSAEADGAVDEFYTHQIEADGSRSTTVRQGSSSSPRFQKTFTDWLGRTTRVVAPSPAGGSGTVETVTEYQPGTGLPWRVFSPGSAPVITVYDTFARPYRTGLDVGGNGALDEGSADRIVEKLDRGLFEGGAWWSLAEEYTWFSTGSPTKTLVSSRKTRLGGFALNQLSEDISTDQEGNATTVVVTADYSRRQVTTTTTIPGLAQTAQTVALDGLAVWSRAPDGLVTKTAHDRYRRPITVYVPKINGAATEFNNTHTLYRDDLPVASAQVHRVIDPSGLVSETLYESGTLRPSASREGRLSAPLDLASPLLAPVKEVKTAYNRRGQVTHLYGTGASPVRYVYNAYGERTEQHTFRDDGGGYASPAAFPAIDSPATDRVRWEHDPASGVLLRKTDALGRFVKYDYDAAGRIQKRYWARHRTPGVTTLPATDADRLAATLDYHPATGDLLTLSYNDGATPAIYTEYDRLGRKTALTDAAGRRTFAYDPARPWRYAGETLPDFFGSRTLTPLRAEVTSTGAGTWGEHTLAFVKGAATGYALGVAGAPERDLRLDYQIANTGRFAGLHARAFGGDGGTGPFHYTYAGQSRLVSALRGDQVGHTLARAYDPVRGLLTRIETRRGSTLRVGYDYAYDARARRTSSTLTGDTLAADYGDALRTDYGYDDRDQLLSADTYLGSTGTARPLPGRRHGYGYDDAGNRLTSTHERTDPAKEADYIANAANQYTARTHAGLPVRGLARADAPVAVDGQSALRQERYFWRDLDFGDTPARGRVYPVAAALAGQGAGGKDAVQLDYRAALFPGATEAFVYDADGNLSSDATWTYAYDAENRLVVMERKEWTVFTGSTPRQRLEFAYDHQGRRIGKRVYHAAGPLGVWQLQKELRFIYDGWNLIAELDARAPGLPLLRSYAWGLDLGGSLTASGGVGALVQIWDHVAGARYLPAYDGNGNLVALFEAGGGTLAAAYEYGPFGEAIRTQGSFAADNPFRFSTKYTDAETGLVYYGMRYYDTKNGRFINRDPIEERGGLNLYGFCGNDGVNRYDVLGMSWFSKAWKKVKKWMGKNKWAALAVGAVLGAFTGGLGWAGFGGMISGNAIVAGAINGAIGGFVGGASSTALMGGSLSQSLTAGAWGALGGAIAGGVGGAYGAPATADRAFSWGYEGARAVTHGVAQGGVAELQGGKFGSGFLSGFAGSMGGSGFGQWFPKAKWYTTIPAVGTIGGFASRLGGGRFEDGFASAAFIEAFNHLAHPPEYMRLIELRDKWEESGNPNPFPLTEDQQRIIFTYEARNIESEDFNKDALWDFLPKLESVDSSFFYRGVGSTMRFRLADGTVVWGGDINYKLQGMAWKAHASFYTDPIGAVTIYGHNVVRRYFKTGNADWAKARRGVIWASQGYEEYESYLQR